MPVTTGRDVHCAHTLDSNQPHLDLAGPALKREPDLEAKLWDQFELLLSDRRQDNARAGHDGLRICRDLHGCREGRRGFQRRNLTNLRGVGLGQKFPAIQGEGICQLARWTQSAQREFDKLSTWFAFMHTSRCRPQSDRWHSVLQ